MTVAALRREDALDICTWRYPAPYDCYDMTDADPEWLLDPASGFHALLSGDRLIGFRSFGTDGQVPGWDYDDRALDTGGGLRPELVGQGLGRRAISAGLAYGRETFAPRAFRVTVASFNTRALRTVEDLDFQRVGRFDAATDGSQLRGAPATGGLRPAPSSRNGQAGAGAVAVARSSCASSTPDDIAQRMVPVARVPSALTTVRSETGSHGRRSGRRVQRGIRATPAAISTAYAGRAATGSSRVQDEEAHRAAGLLGGAQLGAEGVEHRAQLGHGRRRVDHAQLAGDQRRLGDVGVAPGLVEGAGAVRLVRQQEAVDLRRVHPGQQVRVGGGVRRAVGHRAGHPLVDRAHGADRLLGVVDRAEGGDREELAGAGQAPPHVALVARVVGHRLHRRRVHRLQEHRPDAADEHRRVRVHPHDLRVGVEPARARGAVDALARLRAVGSGDTSEDLATEARPQGSHVPTLRGR